MRHIIPISGKDSLTTAIVQKAHEPNLDYEYIFNQVGSEPPEIFAWLDKVELYLGKPIHRIGSNLEQIIYQQGILPTSQVRYCTRLAKIKAMREYTNTGQVTLYYGLRYDEPSRLGLTTNDNEYVRYPLRENKITLQAVYSILRSLDLTPPRFFWNSMFRYVERLLDSDSHLLKRIHSDLFYQWFAWRTRPNCYFCFFQRQYEWIGLLEHHPKLFHHAAKIESEVGASGFTWIKDYPLPDLAKQAKQIKRKRALEIVKMIYQSTQMSLFADTPQDELSVTSCGVFCGK